MSPVTSSGNAPPRKSYCWANRRFILCNCALLIVLVVLVMLVLSFVRVLSCGCLLIPRLPCCHCCEVCFSFFIVMLAGGCWRCCQKNMFGSSVIVFVWELCWCSWYLLHFRDCRVCCSIAWGRKQRKGYGVGPHSHACLSSFSNNEQSNAHLLIDPWRYILDSLILSLLSVSTTTSVWFAVGDCSTDVDLECRLFPINNSL